LLAGNAEVALKHFDKFMNATFVWWEDKARTKPYPLSPLKSDGEILSNNILTNFDGEPMAMFIVYTDHSVGIEVLSTLYNRPDIKLAIGGISFEPTISFEGFETKNIPSLDYETFRIGIAYNYDTKKLVMFATAEKMTIYELNRRLQPLPLKNKFGIDSGGSAQYRYGNMARGTTRVMIGWLHW